MDSTLRVAKKKKKKGLVNYVGKQNAGMKRLHIGLSEELNQAAVNHGNIWSLLR